MTYAFIFPGQGSQSVGMLADLATAYPIVQQTFEEASEILNYDLWQLTQQGPAETLNQTDKTQPALLAASIAIWRVWQGQGGEKPDIMAGHSFGEYSALVCADALTFSDGISLAQKRGQFMQAAVPVGEGAVAAILGLKDADIIAICQQVAQKQVISAVNFNAPGQVVIAGHKSAVERAITQAKNQGAKRAILLPISVPVHCSLMKPAADQMAESLKAVNIAVPKIPIIHNVDVSVNTKADAIRRALTRQIYNPVHWSETIEKMADDGVTLIFECGAGKVLTGLNKRIVRELKSLPIMDIKTLDKALENIL